MTYLHTGSANWSSEVSKLRKMGASMPNSPTQARAEAMNMQAAVNNRSLTASMNRSRLANYRGRQFTGFQGTNMQIALPKVRQPLGSLADKGIPFNVEDDEELKDIRRWSRLFYATHDLVPLLIDIYSKFPVVGLEFSSKDPLIQKFYEDMFFGELNYMEFLPDQLGREFFTCITPGTPVMTDDGHKPIESVAVGDLVLTHTGRLRPVTKVTVTPVNEEVVSIRPRFGQPVTMTRDHRVLVNRGGVKSWIPAGEIRGQKRRQVADKVFVPVLDTTGVTRIDLWDHLDRASWKTFSDVLSDPPNKDSGVRGNTASGIRKRMADESYGPNDVFSAVGHKAQYAPVRHDFIVSDDFLWFLGVVVGDGNCAPDKGTTKVVFNGHEVEFAERAAKVWKEITGREAVIKSVNNEVHVMCYDTVWAHILRDMTYRADSSRRLPSWFHRLSARQAEALYQGLSDSDGYTHQSGACFTQSNRLLIEDVALLARKFEMTPRVYNLGHHSTSFAKKDQYVIRPGSHLSYTEEDELGYWVTVWKTESTHYVGDVYDLTVEDDHSFVTNGFAVHNCGEVTSLAHFNESLGVWSSEEILNPDMLRVSRSLFVQRDRVQLLVKEMVDNLRQGPQGGGLGDADETPSERLNRNREYQDLVRYYPEIIEAAAQNDGLDISDALVSRIVNRSTPWARRGTPHLLRSFRTLMTEESLMAAQDAVADRLYAPLVLATLGIEDMGDGEPWIPDQSELDDARDDLQAALAADFRLMVHNFGLKVENVFGRESVPNLDGDFERVQTKLLQAWGIGEALISGGTGGAYASSALNREFVTQMMVGFQNSLRRHIIKRAEVIAEAQGHYDYDLKGGVRVPIYREIVETDPETGEEHIRRVPKLLIPEIHFSCVVPGTQVLTPAGQRNVEDIQPGDEVIAWDGTSYIIDTALHTGVEHRDRLVEVATATGRTVRCTADHPFWTDRGWVEAENLTTDSLIRTSAGQLAAHVESDDDLDMLRFLGLLVGDGNYSTTHVSLSVSDPEVDAFVCEQAERMGLIARRKIDARTDKVWYRTFVRSTKKGEPLRNPLHTLLREQGMWGKNGHTKRVPPMVWAAGAKGRAAFLSGYFDADGYACRVSGLKITSVNRALLDDCQVLFESLGIRAQVRSYAYRYDGQKNPGMQSVNILMVTNNHYYQMLRDTLSPMIGGKIAALDDMARPSTQGRRNPRPVEWDQVTSVTPLAEGGDIVTLGIANTHTHVTAGLVSHNTLNLRDEAQERAFISQLKAMGVPVSDKTLAVNIDMQFDQELERQAEESVAKLMATAQAMKKVQDLCDAQNLPYPPELAQHLMSTLQLRQGKTQTELGEAQAVAGEAQAEFQTEQIEVQKSMLEQQMMGGGMMPPGAAPGQEQAPPGQEAPPAEGPAQGPNVTPPSAQGPAASGPGNPSAGHYARVAGVNNINGPHGTPPAGSPPNGGFGPELPPGVAEPSEIPRNRQRPAESDEMRGSEPRQVGASRFEAGPSSYGASRRVTEDQVADQIRRLEIVSNWDFTPARHPKVADLVDDPNFYRALNMTAYRGQLQADWPEILAGGAHDSKKILDDMLEQFVEIFGVEPEW